MPMLCLLIHIKLWDPCGERFVSFLQSSWLLGRAPCHCAWEMDGSRVTVPGLSAPGGAQHMGGGARGAGLGPGCAEFHNKPDIMNFCRLGY